VKRVGERVPTLRTFEDGLFGCRTFRPRTRLESFSSMPRGSYLFLKTRLRYRANGAEVTSPGQRPWDSSQAISSALKGRRDPAPLQGAKRSVVPEPRALPWDIILRRIRRRKKSSNFFGSFQDSP
jgi:hypothetical protein